MDDDYFIVCKLFTFEIVAITMAIISEHAYTSIGLCIKAKSNNKKLLKA